MIAGTGRQIQWNLELSVLYFIPVNLDLEKYDSNRNLQGKAIPLPLDYQVKGITCEKEIFCILPISDQSVIEGAFHTIRIAVGMAETLYFNKGVAPYILNQCYFCYLAEDHQNYLEEHKKKERKTGIQPNRLHTLIQQEDFLNSLYIGGMDARCDDNDPEEMLFDIFINTAPDLFAYHSIEVFVKVTAEEEGWNYEISVNGLAG